MATQAVAVCGKQIRNGDLYVRNCHTDIYIDCASLSCRSTFIAAMYVSRYIQPWLMNMSGMYRLCVHVITHLGTDVLLNHMQSINHLYR